MSVKNTQPNLSEVSKKIRDEYRGIAFRKKNLLVFLTGAAAKIYITETTKLMNSRTKNSQISLSMLYISESTGGKN